MSTPKKKAPAKKAADNLSPTPVSAWKAKTGRGEPIKLPSGNVALIDTPGMRQFLARGHIPNSLMSIVSEAIEDGKPPDMSQVKMDQQTLLDFMDTIDSVCLDCVIEPKLHPANDEEGNYIRPSERDPDLLYVDEVDEDDKIFVFNRAVGGTADLTQFRQELAAGMESVSSSKDVESKTE